ncbi:UNVERIFIED_CONTAM: hypothetical protein H355_015960 [Colinus virginianus]|nr:hypothetical protein H355_015960 [Colinus virginianus]
MCLLGRKRAKSTREKRSVVENQKISSVNVNSLCHFFLLSSETISMQDAGPMPTPKTSLQSTQSSAIFKGTDKGEKKKVEVSLMAEIMISDEDDCAALECDVNAQCILLEDGAVCQCLRGFTRKGKSCYDASLFAQCLETYKYIQRWYKMNSSCVSSWFLEYEYTAMELTVWVIDIDECKMGTHTCGENRTCTNTEGNFTCSCADDASGTAMGCESTLSPAVVSDEYSTRPVPGDFIGCPPSYDSYCLHGGMCNYVSDLQDYACNCVTGYVGERCQFSDLEWWEQQHAERVKVRNITIAVCIVVLVLLLGSLAAYCSRSQNFYKKNRYAEAIRDASSRTDNENVTPTCNKSQFAVVKECSSSLEIKAVDLIECETADPHPAYSSQYVEQPITYDKVAETFVEDKRQQGCPEEIPNTEKFLEPTVAEKDLSQAAWSAHPKPCQPAPTSLLMQPD